MTGDVAEAARPPEYADAAAFFKALAKQLELSPHRFVFVPGNHDISWTRCREVEGHLEDGTFPPDELRSRLDEVKFAHFEKFIRDVHGGKARHEVEGASVTLLPRGAFIHDFADLGISVASLNSCERESHRKEDHVGAISDAQAQAVLDHWQRTPAKLIRLLAVHHNPAAMASSAIEQWLTFLRSSAAHVPPDVVERIATNFVGFEGRDYLQRLAADAHASLILHGHHHASEAHQAWAWRGRAHGGAGDARIVSAGSWGLSPESSKLPKDQPVVMQLIRLDPAAEEMHPVLLRYEPGASLSGDVRLGRFLLDPNTSTSRPIGLSLPPEYDTWLGHNQVGIIAKQGSAALPGAVRNLDELRLAYETTVRSKHPCVGASIADLDWTLIDLYVEKIGDRRGFELSKEDTLRNLGLFSPLAPAGQPTLHQAAVLCFCQRPERYVPQARAVFVVGQTTESQFQRSDIYGPLSLQIKQLVEKIQSEVQTIVTLDEGGLRREEPHLPMAVVREIISNAVVHRDYTSPGTIRIWLKSDALEVQSPGAFPGGLSWETLMFENRGSIPVDAAVVLYVTNLLAFEGIGRGFEVVRRYIAERGKECISCTFTENPPAVVVRIARLRPASRRLYELSRVRADLVVLTSLREEYEAVLDCLTTPSLLLGSEGAPNEYAWQLGTINSPRYRAMFQVVVGMGTLPTTYGALAAMQAIRLFNPRYIAFVGVAGGLDRDGQRRGDVAVSSAIMGYEYDKVDTGRFASRSVFTYRCDEGLVRAVEAVTRTRWWREDDNTRQPRVRTGIIASGDKLIDEPNETFFGAVGKMWPKLLAVEMESAGVAAAVHETLSAGHRARFVLVRGISDMPATKAADEGASTGERDSWKRTAAHNAARFVAHLVAEAWPERPRDERHVPSDGESAGEIVPSAAAGEPAVSGVMMGGEKASVRQELAQGSEEVRALAQQLTNAHARKKRLAAAGVAMEVLGGVEREIRELKRRLREGGWLVAGDMLGEGRYLLLEELGRGGFAVVWKAQDNVENRPVAVKVLHANLAGDVIRRERFYRGARAMMRLQHDGVVRVLEPEGEDGGFCYFVMELASSGNLHDAVVAKRVSGSAVLEHILRVGDALAEAQALGIIHRDIKPQNILLDERFEAKLTDFDLVLAKDTTGGTRTGAMGTVIYAAPECLERPQEATEQADVYGLGMTAIFCLAGRALTLSILRSPEPIIAGLDCSGAVKEVLRHAVAWDREARYANASAMVSALRVALHTEMSTDPGAKVADGDAGSGADAGGGVPPGVAMPRSGAPLTDGMPLESQGSGNESQPGNPRGR